MDLNDWVGGLWCYNCNKPWMGGFATMCEIECCQCKNKKFMEIAYGKSNTPGI